MLRLCAGGAGGDEEDGVHQLPGAVQGHEPAAGARAGLPAGRAGHQRQPGRPVRLVVKGRFLPKAFEGVLRRYVNECALPDYLGFLRPSTFCYVSFLLAELGTSGNLDGQQRLIVKGRFLPKAFEGVLRRYVSGAALQCTSSGYVGLPDAFKFLSPGGYAALCPRPSRACCAAMSTSAPFLITRYCQLMPGSGHLLLGDFLPGYLGNRGPPRTAIPGHIAGTA